MKYITCLVLLIFSLLCVASVNGQVSKEDTIKTSTSPAVINQNQIDNLRTQFEAIRSENYERAVKGAEDAGKKADYLLNGIVAITALVGFVILVITFTVLRDIYSLKNQLNLQVDNARKTLQSVNSLYTKAETKFGVLLPKLEKAWKKPKEGEETKDEIKKLIDEAKGTISEIRSLKNSASFASGASLSYPPYGGTVTYTEPIGPFTNQNTKKCRKCGNPLPANPEGYVAYGDPDLCWQCKVSFGS